MGEAKRRSAAAHTVLPNGVRLTRNRATPEGREAGKFLARMAASGEPSIRLKFPAHEPACASCAFRAGTVPNGCSETVADAFACLVESEPFFCHQHFNDDGSPRDLCAGWAFANASKEATALREVTGGKVPFDPPARSPEALAYIDEERQKIRAKRRAPSPDALPPHPVGEVVER